VGEFAEAATALAHAEGLQREDMLTQFRLGRLAEESGDIDEASLRMAKALAIDPTPAWLWRHYANLLKRAGKIEEADIALLKAKTSA
jgi:tetratricopeptide (TPR) repeat protein